MKLNNRKVHIGLLILILVALNVWHWWPTQNSVHLEARQSLNGLVAEDFLIKGLLMDSLPSMGRNIFTIRKEVVAVRKVKVSPKTLPLPPEKSPDEIAREQAQAEYAQIRCAGISIRNEHSQAYIINGGEYLLVSNGDKVGGRFKVEKVVSEGVYLRDAETGVGGLITVSGR